MEKRNRNILILSIIALVLLFTGLTYAYFSARITGLESASTLSLTAGRMGIVYSEDDARVEVSNIYPRAEAWLTKQITLTGYNTTDQSMEYNLAINVTTNTFTNGYLTYDLRLVSGTNGTPIATKTGVSLNGTGKIKLGTGSFQAADGDAHVYELKIYFKDNGQDQNESQGAVFNGKINVEESLPITYKYFGWSFNETTNKVNMYNTFDEAAGDEKVIYRIPSNIVLVEGVIPETCAKIGTGQVCLSESTTNMQEQCATAGGVYSEQYEDSEKTVFCDDEATKVSCYQSSSENYGCQQNFAVSDNRICSSYPSSNFRCERVAF